MGLRWELVEEYSAAVQALEKSAASRRDGAARQRQEWRVRVVDDLQHGVMSPLVLLAIKEWRTDERRLRAGR